MTAEEDMIHLNNLAQCIMEIEGYTKDLDYEDFLSDEEDKAAVMSNLNQIGEASRLLSDDFKDQYDDIDLKVLEGLRNAEYNDEMELDLHGVWHIISRDLPYIREKVLDALTQLEQQEDLEG
jgi:uncharacterized protein with HEPN domain